MSASLCSSSTASSGWVEYISDGIYRDIDLSGCGFTSAPIITSSLAGSGHHWISLGGSEPYSITATGFRIHVYYAGITSSKAKARRPPGTGTSTGSHIPRTSKLCSWRGAARPSFDDLLLLFTAAYCTALHRIPTMPSRGPTLRTADPCVPERPTLKIPPLDILPGLRTGPAQVLVWQCQMHRLHACVSLPSRLHLRLCLHALLCFLKWVFVLCVLPKQPSSVGVWVL